MPLLKEQLPKDLGDRVVDIVRLNIHASDREVLEATIASMRERHAATDREHVEALLGAYRADGLGVVGVEATRRALELGQVDELVITAAPDTIDAQASAGGEAAAAAEGNSGRADRTPEERVADELVAKARQSAADVRVIEDPSLMAAVGGVGALLRFKL